MASKKRTSRGIALPWEQRGAWMRDLLAGPRWKVALLVVVLGIVAWGIWRASVREAEMRETRAAIAEVRRAIESFRTEVGRCPRSTAELVDPPRPGRRYLREIPPDGWGRQLWVRCPARNDPAGADVISAGPSGSFFVDDNVM
jgi:type II secretory pathway pseudopilin PulG